MEKILSLLFTSLGKDGLSDLVQVLMGQVGKSTNVREEMTRLLLETMDENGMCNVRDVLKNMYSKKSSLFTGDN